jgi:hypothetical protein
MTGPIYVDMCSTCGEINPDHPDDYRCPKATPLSHWWPRMPTIDDQIQEARLREARAHADLAELRLQQERMQATPARTDPPASSQPATCSICSQGIRFDGTALFVGRVYNWSVYICGECTPKVREALRTAKP